MKFIFLLLFMFLYGCDMYAPYATNTYCKEENRKTKYYLNFDVETRNEIDFQCNFNRKMREAIEIEKQKGNIKTIDDVKNFEKRYIEEYDESIKTMNNLKDGQSQDNIEGALNNRNGGTKQ